MTFAFGNPLSHFRGTAPSPTADLYFAWSCARMIEDGRVLRLYPTVFQSGGTLIVFRHAGPIRKLPPHDRLIYFTDDDWRAGMEKGALPIDYWLKLTCVEARAAKSLQSAADVIVVSSPALERRLRSCFRSTGVERIHPCWPLSSAVSLNGLPEAPTIAMLGGRSHALDAAIVLPAMREVLSERPDIRFIVSAELPLPVDLARNLQVERAPSGSWDAYRSWMGGRSFTLGLYPLRDTGFNRARSINKLLEYDQFGAVVLGSESWEAAHAAAADERCVLVGNDGRAWADRILDLLHQPEKAKDIAARNRAAIVKDGAADKQYAFWSHLLN